MTQIMTHLPLSVMEDTVSTKKTIFNNNPGGGGGGAILLG